MIFLFFSLYVFYVWKYITCYALIYAYLHYNTLFNFFLLTSIKTYSLKFLFWHIFLFVNFTHFSRTWRYARRIENANTTSYFFQLGFNMMGMTFTIFQVNAKLLLNTHSVRSWLSSLINFMSVESFVFFMIVFLVF